jgi:outer membrane lipoprotein-sorting protein
VFPHSRWISDGRQLLAHSDDALFTARTVHLEFDATAEVSVSGLQTKVLSSELLDIGGGNRFRHSARLGENEVLTVSDGASVWTYSPKNKTCRVVKFEPDSLRQRRESRLRTRPREYPLRQR